jgi:hypothetical protein
MKVHLEPFVAEHGVEILGAGAEAMLDWLIKAECSGMAFTGRLQDGALLGAAGLMLQTPQIADAWLLPTPLVKVHPVLFHRTVCEWLKRLIDENAELRCIYGYTDPAFPERERWLTRIGFERIGQMRALWPVRKDILLYGMLITRNGHGT